MPRNRVARRFVYMHPATTAWVGMMTFMFLTMAIVAIR